MAYDTETKLRIFFKGLNFFKSDFREAKRFVIVTCFFFFSDLGSDFGGFLSESLSSQTFIHFQKVASQPEVVAADLDSYGT